MNLAYKRAGRPAAGRTRPVSPGADRTGNWSALDAMAAALAAALIAWLSGTVARWKLPRRVSFWDALPTSGTGTVTKRAIRTALEARGCLPRDGTAAPARSARITGSRSRTTAPG